MIKAGIEHPGEQGNGHAQGRAEPAHPSLKMIVSCPRKLHLPVVIPGYRLAILGHRQHLDPKAVFLPGKQSQFTKGGSGLARARPLSFEDVSPAQLAGDQIWYPRAAKAFPPPTGGLLDDDLEEPVAKPPDHHIGAVHPGPG